MFKVRKSLVLLMVVLVLGVGIAQANYISNGDMELGGSSTTPPTGWAMKGSPGNFSASSDTPDASLQSMKIEGLGGGVTTYAQGWSDPGVYGGLAMQFGFDCKGDVYWSLREYTPSGSAQVTAKASKTADWTTQSVSWTAAADATQYKILIYDSTAGERAAYVDNLVMVPEPATMALLGIGGVSVLLRRRRK